MWNMIQSSLLHAAMKSILESNGIADELFLQSLTTGSEARIPFAVSPCSSKFPTSSLTTVDTTVGP